MSDIFFPVLSLPELPSLESPEIGEIEDVLRSPDNYGDNAEVGAIRLEWREAAPVDPGTPITIDMSNPPAVIKLDFYLGHSPYVMLLYTNTSHAIYERAIGPGDHFESELFYAEDTGASEIELDKKFLLSIGESLKYVREFIENEGDIEI